MIESHLVAYIYSRLPPYGTIEKGQNQGRNQVLKTGVENEGEKAVANSRCHTQSGQEMDRIRLCDIGRRNIGPTVRSVDRALETIQMSEKRPVILYIGLARK